MSDEGRKTIREFKDTVEDADAMIEAAIRLCAGKLRVNGPSYYRDRACLKELKRELGDFNAATRKWKGEPR